MLKKERKNNNELSSICIDYNLSEDSHIEDEDEEINKKIIKLLRNESKKTDAFVKNVENDKKNGDKNLEISIEKSLNNNKNKCDFLIAMFIGFIVTEMIIIWGNLNLVSSVNYQLIANGYIFSDKLIFMFILNMTIVGALIYFLTMVLKIKDDFIEEIIRDYDDKKIEVLSSFNLNLLEKFISEKEINEATSISFIKFLIKKNKTEDSPPKDKRILKNIFNKYSVKKMYYRMSKEGFGYKHEKQMKKLEKLFCEFKTNKD